MRKIIVLIFTVLLVACQRNEPITNPDPVDEEFLFYAGILNEYVLTNEIFQDVVNNTGNALLIAEGALTSKTNNSKSTPTISIEPFDFETFPKTITVNYGSGTLCEDGIIRSGVIVIESTGWFWEQGSIQTITFDNYFHDIFKVEGTQVVENNGQNEDGYIEFRVTVEDGLVEFDDGISITFNEDSIRTWIAGYVTSTNIWDDEYLLDTYQYGVSSNGTNYLLVFDEPLHYVLAPRAIRSGIINLEIGSVSNIEINYINGTYTILGITKSWN